MITRYYIKSLLTNKSLLFWGLIFMIFWLFMGAFVFGFEYNNRNYSLFYASSWYSVIALFSLSSIGTSVAYSIYYSGHSLIYLFRFSKLKPFDYIYNLLLSTSIVGAILGVLLLGFSSLFFSIRSGFSITPIFPSYAILISILGGAFMFLLAVNLVVLVNNYMGLKNITFISFIPLMLSYVFGFSLISIKLPTIIIYLSPFSEIVELFFFSYYGKNPTVVLSEPSSSLLNIYYLAVCLLIWDVFMFIFSTVLIRRIKPRSIEEARQI